MSPENLARFETDPYNRFRQFWTMYESWVQYFQPESKEQSKQWKVQGLPPPKNAKVFRSAGKVMTSVLWEKEGCDGGLPS